MAERKEGIAVAVAGVPAFLSGLSFDRLPAEVVLSAHRSLLDLIGVAVAGSHTRVAKIAATYAATQLCGSDRSSRILLDGRRAGLAGAAFAGATAIDALDGHDGHALTKGHAGAALLPALLALIDGSHPGERAHGVEGREFLTCLVIGYEIATRAGIALHGSVADYHCSGAWNALGCAAIASRLLDFDEVRTRHALGCAEYFAPRGQILRACDSPTMVKDGSGWGAYAGLAAALLARDGFTGAPALTVEGDDAVALWSDLGVRWRIGEQYFKPYPVCRWAQPAIEAALELRRTPGFRVDQVEAVVIESFREAVALGSRCAMPGNTEEAQYSLAFGVAAALVFDRVGFDEVTQSGLSDPRVARLVGAIRPVENPEFSRRFPAERWARVQLVLTDGRTLSSRPAQARGGPENPLDEVELRNKYRELASPIMGASRASRIEKAIDGLGTDRAALPTLLAEVLHDSTQPD